MIIKNILNYIYSLELIDLKCNIKFNAELKAKVKIASCLDY